MGIDAALDPVPGGEYRVGMRGGVQASGVFLEIDPPRRVVFTWGWTGDHRVPPGTTRVVVTLSAADCGTLVVLRNHGLPNDEQRTQHRGGWLLYLGRLHIRAAGGDPGRTRTAEHAKVPVVEGISGWATRVGRLW